MNPASKTFFVFSIILIALGAVLVITGSTGGGIACAVIGMLGLLINSNAKKKEK